MSKSNLAEEFLFEEKITEEEFSNLQLNNDVNDFCHINEMDGKKYLTTLKSNTLEYSKIPRTNNIKISQNYIVNKIILHDVPDANYLLKINGKNAATFKKIKKNDGNDENNEYFDYYVDIKNLTNSVTDEYKSYCEVESHIDLSRIDSFLISYPKNTNFKSEHIHYSLCGIKCDEINNVYKKINTKYRYYLNTIYLSFSHPTYFINFISKTIDPCKKGNIYVYINGVMIKNIIVNNNDYDIYRINFNDVKKKIKKKFSGTEDKYLSSEIFSKTINLSRVDDLQIAFSNVIISSITQFHYYIYLLPQMMLMFSS